MKKIQSEFKQFAISKQATKTIKGGENTVIVPLATNVAITDPYRKRDKN